MNIKKAAFYTCLSFITQNLYTEAPGTVTVVIHGQEIVAKSKIGLKVQKELQTEQEASSKPLQKDEQEIRAKEQNLINKKRELDKDAEEIANSKILSQEAKQRKFEEMQDRVRQLEEDKAELERLTKRLQADAKRFETKMSQLYQEKMNKIDVKIKEVIEFVAQREGWDIVEMKEQIVYASSRVNKTDIIIKELDTLDAKEEAPKKTQSKL